MFFSKLSFTQKLFSSQLEINHMIHEPTEVNYNTCRPPIYCFYCGSPKMVYHRSIFNSVEEGEKRLLWSTISSITMVSCPRVVRSIFFLPTTRKTFSRCGTHTLFPLKFLSTAYNFVNFLARTCSNFCLFFSFLN